jgi:hypothetical protein
VTVPRYVKCAELYVRTVRACQLPSPRSPPRRREDRDEEVEKVENRREKEREVMRTYRRREREQSRRDEKR